MAKLWLVIKREYATRVKTKAFIFTTILMPVLTVGYLVFVAVLATRQGSHTLRMAVLDEAGGVAGAVAERLDEKLASGRPAFRVVESLERAPADDASARADLRARITRGELDAYLVIPRGTLQDEAAEFHTKNPGDLTLTAPIRRAVSDAVIARRLNDRGLKVDDVSRVVRSVDVKLIKVTLQGEVEEKGQTLAVAFVMMMVLYMTLIIYGVSTMRSVLEEKTTRIIEILVSSVRPSVLLTGKILGVAGVALTQYLIWAATGGLLAAYGATMASAVRPGVSVPSLHLPWVWLVYLVLFFLAGYLLYASMYAAVGAIVSSDQDAQQYSIPVTLPIVVSVIMFQIVLRDPSSPLSVTLSLVPVFSPILMMFRIALQTPPFWQIALSLALLVLGIFVVIFVSGKIYRVGILMYGKRPSLIEILRWLRYT